MLTSLCFQVMSLFCSLFRCSKMKILKKKIKIATKFEIEKKNKKTKSFILFQEASSDKNLLYTLKLKFNCRRFDFHNF